MFTAENIYRINGSQELLDRIIEEIGMIPIPDPNAEFTTISEPININLEVDGIQINIKSEILNQGLSFAWLSWITTDVVSTYYGKQALIYIDGVHINEKLAGTCISL